MALFRDIRSDKSLCTNFISSNRRSFSLVISRTKALTSNPALTRILFEIVDRSLTMEFKMTPNKRRWQDLSCQPDNICFYITPSSFIVLKTAGHEPIIFHRYLVQGREHLPEEHLLPLMVVAGAAGDAQGINVFTERVLGATVSAYQFG